MTEATVEAAEEIDDVPAAPVEADDALAASSLGEEFSEESDLESGELPFDPVPSGELRGALEAILLVVDNPVATEELAATVGHFADAVRAELRAIAAELTARQSGMDLREVGGGWRLYTRDHYAPVVERYVLDGTATKLSRAALETLAVVAYRQPITRSRIAAVRGVNVDGIVRTLTARGLLTEDGADPDTGGILYRTTELFLDVMGLASLEDLPALGPLLPDVDQIDDE